MSFGNYIQRFGMGTGIAIILITAISRAFSGTFLGDALLSAPFLGSFLSYFFINPNFFLGLGLFIIIFSIFHKYWRIMIIPLVIFLLYYSIKSIG